MSPLQARRAAELRRRRRLRHAKIVHGLGWRVTFEAFDRLARDFDEATVDHLLERYAGLDRGVLEALHVNDLPLTPIRVIGATGTAS
jgi:hypothetical protein